MAATMLGGAASWNIANVGAAADEIAAHFHIELATVGLFTTALFAAQCLLMLPSGHLIDRFGPREVGLAAIAILIAGNVLSLVASSVVTALVLRFAIGFAVAAGMVAGPAYVRAIGGGVRDQGFYGGAVFGAGGLAVAAGALLEPALGWRAPFTTALAAALVALPFVARGPARCTATSGHSPARTLLLDPRLLRFTAVFASSFGAAVVLSNWAAPYLIRRAELDPSSAGVVAALILGMSLLGRPLGGLLVDRRPRGARPALALSACAGGGATLVLSAGPPLPVTVVATAVVGLMAGLPYGIVIAGVGRTFPAHVATAVGAMSTYAVFAVLVGAPLVGLTFALPGEGMIGFGAAGLLWMASLAALPRAEALEDLGPQPVAANATYTM